ncbi:hypothetical protein BCS98_02580 [Vibrio breoganii]|nr:hypothetical protein BCT73_01375 [Vibrio breoganii]PMO77410.1 hypothetical protein BCT00_01375 [Vibrio breoganii]PMO89454.1 hypothetical protein BCS98_02580 [Vibrio breoganii]
MVSMGMGKNMVMSVRHWIKALQLVEPSEDKETDFKLTPLAESLFVDTADRKAWDEFLDKVGTIWLLHWLTQSIPLSNAELNTARWYFNYFNGVRIDKQQLARDINLSLVNHDKELTEATLRKDIDCFFQTYSTKYSVNKKLTEDSFTSPFTELGLLVQLDGKTYLSELSNRKSLPDEVFVYALIDFMQKKRIDQSGTVISDESTFSFDNLLNGIGSPGRVFRLTANGLSEKLDAVERITNGKIAWTDTQGLRQVQHSFDDLQAIDPSTFLNSYYKR